MRTCTLLIAGLLFLAAGAVQAQGDGTADSLVDFASEPLPQPMVWARGEYLLWWIKDGPLPPLVTLGNPADALPGALGQPGTRLLIGGSDTDYGVRSGGRFTTGAWLDEEQLWGLEANYLFLGERGVEQAVSSSGLPGSATLAIPFFNPATNREESTFVSSPGRSFGGAAFVAQTSRLHGTEINGLANVSDGGGLRIDLLGGFRYLFLRETLALSTSSPFLPPLPRDVFATRDEFTTRNNFYGGQFGARAEYFTGRVFVNSTGKVALGSVQQSANITGGLLTNDFNGFVTPVPFSGGYLALPTNIGAYNRSRFAVVPEVDINIGYQFRRGSRFFVGYTFLYASAFARPGDQIDRGINPTQGVAFNSNPNATLVGPARPAFSFNETSFWAQGLNFGFDFRF